MALHSQDMTARVMAAFSGAEIGRARVSFGYRAGMLGVLLGLVVLPLLYVGMIAGACWLLVWHLRHDLVWFEVAEGMTMTSPNTLIIAGIAYIGTAIAGVIFIVFLLRPLFTPPPREPPPVTLDPTTEQALFTLIHRLCDLIGSPRPTEVRVNCQMNASADYRRGVASFFANDLVLTIGMPLVAGMNVQQFAGVLAHELGHFARGGGMRMDYLVRGINSWFGRLVHGRDPWEGRLDILEEGGRAKRFVALTAKGMIWLGRLILEGFMKAGGALSGVTSRRMEHDADACAAEVVGSRGYAESLLTLPVLAYAQKRVADEMFMLIKSGSLPDNVPLRVNRHDNDLPAAEREKLRQRALADERRWWHTQPTLYQRREAVGDLATRGIFHLEEPASLLFADFSTLCKTVSAYWYEVEMGLDLNQFDLVNMDGLEKRHHVQETHEGAVKEIFGRMPPPHRLIPLPGSAPDHATQTAMVEAWKADYNVACEREKDPRHRALLQTLGCHLVRMGFGQGTLNQVGLDVGSLEASQAAGLQAYETLSSQMQVFELAAWGRVAAALEWQYQQPGTDMEWQQRVGLLVEAQRALATAVQHLATVQVDAWVVDFAGRNGAGHGAGGDLNTLLRGHDRRVHAALMRVMAALGTAADPFAEKLAKFSDRLCLPKLASENSFYALEWHTPLMNAVHEHAGMVTGELCELANEAERMMASHANMLRAVRRLET